MLDYASLQLASLTARCRIDLCWGKSPMFFTQRDIIGASLTSSEWMFFSIKMDMVSQQYFLNNLTRIGLMFMGFFIITFAATRVSG
jgi:hypothetical protein